MSFASIRPTLADLVAKALMGGDFSGVLLRYDGQCFIQHDALQIDSSDKQLKLHFLWKGEKVWSLDVGPIGHPVIIEGVEGRMKVSIQLT